MLKPGNDKTFRTVQPTLLHHVKTAFPCPSPTYPGQEKHTEPHLPRPGEEQDKGVCHLEQKKEMEISISPRATSMTMHTYTCRTTLRIT